MENIKTELAELLEVDQVNDTDVLQNFECWDSLTILSILALASEKYNVNISAKEVDNAITIGGLIDLITNRKL